MPLDPELQTQLLEALSEALQEHAVKVLAIYKPQWDIRNDTVKTLLTISSGVLVISVSLSSQIGRYKWILAVTWTAFGLAIICAIATLWLSQRLYSFGGAMFHARTRLRDTIKGIEIDNLIEARRAFVDKLVDENISAAIDAMERDDRRATKTLHATLWMFLAGLLFTAVAGWMRLYL